MPDPQFEPKNYECQLGLDADHIDRLNEALSRVQGGPTLRATAELLAEQLELITPGVMHMGPGGMYAGRCVRAPIGTVLIVIADATRVCTVYCGLAAGATARNWIDEAVQFASNEVMPTGKRIADMPLLGTMTAMLETIGGPPGAKTPDAGPGIYPVIGALFSCLPEVARANLGTAIDATLADAICPAIVGLMGPSSSGRPDRYAAAWPLVMPLAYYAEFVSRMIDGDRPDA